MGRPSSYTDSVADAILNRIAGGEALYRICKDDGMPDPVTVRNWLATRPDFLTKYARAREAQADTLADEILQIADDDATDPQSRRVRVDARKWLAGKLRPKVYGDKLDVSAAVQVGGALRQELVVTVVDPANPDPA